MDNPKLKYLDDVPWDNTLKLSNGKTVHGLEQLPLVIKFSDDEVFYSHVNEQKNDFANWIRDVIGDSELAEKLLNVKTKDDFLAFMDKSITEIKHYVPKESSAVPLASISAASTQAPVISVPESSATASPVVASVVSSPTAIVAPVVSTLTAQVISPPIVVTPISAPLSFPQSVFLPLSTPIISESQIVSSSSDNILPSYTSTSIVQSNVTPVVSTDSVPVSPVSSSVVSSASVNVSVPEAQASSPIVASISPSTNSIPISESATTVSQNAAAQILPSVSMTEIAEETFDFEEVFRILITELEREVLSWDVQTS